MSAIDIPEWKFVLDDDNNIVAEPDVLVWAAWYEQAWDAGRLPVGNTRTPTARVSTVFLAVGDRDRLFETAVFPFGGEMKIVGRWPTWQRAQEMHALTVKRWGGASGR